ncbi:hypothetical protein [Streptacidiphilus sp. P02-A3a]|uniref:hypothetical protein n=1 Tax=Streptacidiphilus sp. P02-A3a TaxID=2704468 RepID=UPI0015F85E75|nr:hypothetical protein [Streptacidiphilus sp. P02-A3a]QMU68993.1 hypothetical protein GXP74_12840 [Streptacidiphilus sp. P02-A3a]
MTTDQTLERVPFGARGLKDAFRVRIDPSEFTFDSARQLNVTPTGELWAATPMAASSTATNADSNGKPPDEGADPYAFPGDEPERL